MQVHKTITGGGGGADFGSIADNQIARGNPSNEIQGSNSLIFDGTSMVLQGSSTDRFVRFVETVGQFNGAFLQYEGSTNKFHMGVHATGNVDVADDDISFTMLRSNGYIGIFNENPTAELDIVGTVKTTGATIAPTYANFAGRFATGGTPAYGGSRLGDSDLQTNSVDIGSVINFIDDSVAQQVNFSIFENSNVMTIRSSGGDHVGVLDFNGAYNADYSSDDAEATFAATIIYDDGKGYVNDMGVQRYLPGVSVVAQTFFHVLQTLDGADVLDYWFGRYDGSDYEPIFVVDENNIVTFEEVARGVPAVGNNDFIIKSQVYQSSIVPVAITNVANTLTTVLSGNMNLTWWKTGSLVTFSGFLPVTINALTAGNDYALLFNVPCPFIVAYSSVCQVVIDGIAPKEQMKCYAIADTDEKLDIYVYVDDVITSTGGSGGTLYVSGHFTSVF